MGETWLAGMIAGFGIAIPIGAVGALVVSLTARTSWRTGAAAALGVASADGVYAMVAVLAGQVVAVWIRPVEEVLRLLAAVVLLVLAAKTAVDGVRRFRWSSVGVVVIVSRSAARHYAAFLGLTLVNPATVVYFAALVAGGQARTSTSTLAGPVFALAAFVASALWQLTLVGGGALLGRVAASARGRLVTSLVAAVIIATLAVRTVFSR